MLGLESPRVARQAWVTLVAQASAAVSVAFVVAVSAAFAFIADIPDSPTVLRLSKHVVLVRLTEHRLVGNPQPIGLSHGEGHYYTGVVIEALRSDKLDTIGFFSALEIPIEDSRTYLAALALTSCRPRLAGEDGSSQCPEGVLYTTSQWGMETLSFVEDRTVDQRKSLWVSIEPPYQWLRPDDDAVIHRAAETASRYIRWPDVRAMILRWLSSDATDPQARRVSDRHNISLNWPADGAPTHALAASAAASYFRR